MKNEKWAEIREKVKQYLTETYDPELIIAYGSFADESAGENSDFDAMIVADTSRRHDDSVIDGILLDVFIYPPSAFDSGWDPGEFTHLLDGTVLSNRNGLADKLLEQIRQAVRNMPPKTEEELRHEVDWCRKMLARTARGDAEGNFRWHWLLTDSLEFYCDIRRISYQGPKKMLRRMAADDPEGFRLYSGALEVFTREALADWIGYLEKIFEKNR